MRFLKVFTMDGSSRPIDASSLDIMAMDVYRRYPTEIKALGHWTECAERDLFAMLKRFARVVDNTQPPPAQPTKLYRGFNPGSFQENLGIDGDARVGLEGMFQHPGKLISCSTNIEIAKIFCDVVIEFEQNLSQVSNLRLTDELMYLVCTDKNIDPVSQDEVILLPPVSMKWSVVHVS